LRLRGRGKGEKGEDDQQTRKTRAAWHWMLPNLSYIRSLSDVSIKMRARERRCGLITRQPRPAFSDG
jgi:hypothetical protein